MRSPDWLTVSEIAEELGVHPATVRRWIRDRRLRAQAITLRPSHTTFRIRGEDYRTFRSTLVRDTLEDDWER